MRYDFLFHILLGFAPALAGLSFCLFVMWWLYRDVRMRPLIKEQEAEVFTYSAKMKTYQIILGTLFLVFAVGPLALAGLEYYNHDYGFDGSDPVWISVFLLYLFFGFFGVFCIIDPLRSYAKIDSNGVRVRGFLLSERFIPWKNVGRIVNHSSLRMLSIDGKDSDGKKRILLFSHGFEYLSIFLNRLNSRGFFLKEVLEEMEKIKAYLWQQGYYKVDLYKLYLPFWSFWYQPGNPEKYIAVLFGVEEDKRTTHYEHFKISSYKEEDMLNEVKGRFVEKSFNFHPKFQEDLVRGVDYIIERNEQYNKG